MRLRPFSPKQRRVMRWWCDSSGDKGYDVIICDGAVRSGKTLCMGLSFVCWAMSRFDGRSFALCGKTIGSLRRNVVLELLPVLRELGLRCQEKRSENLLVIRGEGRENRFYLMGGKDEGSASLIQGATLAGVLLDEVALMPRSFVEQAMARCSVEGSRIWCNCNPEGPYHWFYREWVQKAEEKRVLRLRFTMEDNPGLTPQVRERYAELFQGAFYRRFVLGEWVAAEGLVYDFFDGRYLRDVPEGEMEQWYISCDYGTANPTSMGLWGLQGGVWYRVAESYYDARERHRQRTDEEHADALEELAGGRAIRAVVADPSAASFCAALRRRGWRVRRANNQVLSGIRLTAQLLKSGRLVICRGCEAAIREFGLYRWDEDGQGQDRVKKEHDHAMDEIRYFAATVVAGRSGGGLFAGSVERNGV